MAGGVAGILQESGLAIMALDAVGQNAAMLRSDV
jgi:hypothetical protein